MEYARGSSRSRVSSTLSGVKVDSARTVGLSWRAQAFLWPALSSAVTLIGLGGFALARDGFRYWPGPVESIAWIIVVVPAIVGMCSLIFGGAAVMAAVLVRGVVRVLRPTASFASRTVWLAAVTGSGAACLVIGFHALLRQSWTIADAAYGYATAIGVVAAFASALYARRLFGEATDDPYAAIV